MKLLHAQLQSGSRVSRILPAPSPSARLTDNRRDSPMALGFQKNRTGKLNENKKAEVGEIQ